MRDYKLRKKVFNDYATKEELENAGGGGALVCHLGEALDHTWNEINSAMRAGKNVVVICDISGSARSVAPVLACMQEGEAFAVVVEVDGPLSLIANSADGYPTFSSES